MPSTFVDFLADVDPCSRCFLHILFAAAASTGLDDHQHDVGRCRQRLAEARPDRCIGPSQQQPARRPGRQAAAGRRQCGRAPTAPASFDRCCAGTASAGRTTRRTRVQTYDIAASKVRRAGACPADPPRRPARRLDHSTRPRRRMPRRPSPRTRPSGAAAGIPHQCARPPFPRLRHKDHDRPRSPQDHNSLHWRTSQTTPASSPGRLRGSASSAPATVWCRCAGRDRSHNDAPYDEVSRCPALAWRRASERTRRPVSSAGSQRHGSATPTPRFEAHDP